MTELINIIDINQKNTIISCCSIFSNKLDLIKTTQLCKIIFKSDKILDCIILYGLEVKIEISVPFSIDYQLNLIKLLVNSYLYSKKNKNEENNQKNPLKTDLLNTLIFNLKNEENDYFEDIIKDKKNFDYNNNQFFKLINSEIIDNINFKCTLIFKDYFIASYYFNRFLKSFKINDKEYLITILPLIKEQSLTKLKLKKTNLNCKDYFLNQLNDNYSDYLNFTNNLYLPSKEFLKNQNDYFILFHPNILLDYSYNLNKITNYLDFLDLFKELKFINYNNNKCINHNITWFYLQSNQLNNEIIKCFKYEKYLIQKEVKLINDKNFQLLEFDSNIILNSNIQMEEFKETITPVITEIKQFQNKESNSISSALFIKKKSNENKPIEQYFSLSNKRRRNDDKEEIENKILKKTKIDHYFVFNKK